MGSSSVVTLALGSRPRQGFVRGRAKRETQECGRVWEWTLTLPSELPCWELESRWTLESSESNFKGQNPSPWRFTYIIGKLLKHRCLKWVRMTHLDIWNTIYGQKKGRESNWQFDSRPRKVGNRPDSLACRWRATRCWKTLENGYNFALDLISIEGLQKKLLSHKVAEVPTLAISGLPLGSLGTKSHLDEGVTERCRVYMGEGGGFPWVRAVVSLICSKSLVTCPSTNGAPTMH